MDGCGCSAIVSAASRWCICRFEHQAQTILCVFRQEVVFVTGSERSAGG